MSFQYNTFCILYYFVLPVIPKVECNRRDSNVTHTVTKKNQSAESHGKSIIVIDNVASY